MPVAEIEPRYLEYFAPTAPRRSPRERARPAISKPEKIV